MDVFVSYEYWEHPTMTKGWYVFDIPMAKLTRRAIKYIHKRIMEIEQCDRVVLISITKLEDEG